MARHLGNAAVTSGKGFFGGIFGFFKSFPRGAFAITFIIILLFSYGVDALKTKNPAVFISGAADTFSIDERLEAEISGLRGTAEANDGTISAWRLIIPGIKVIGLLYLLYYLYYFWASLFKFGNSNDSVGGLVVVIGFVIVFGLLQYANVLIQAELAGEPSQISTGAFYLDNLPFRGVVSLIRNYDLWLPNVRPAAEWFLDTNNSALNTTNETVVAVDLT